jgi:hypothetical protein
MRVVEAISVVGGVVFIAVGASTGLIPLVVLGCGLVAIPILGRLATRKRSPTPPNYNYLSENLLDHVSYALKYEEWKARTNNSN